MGWRPYGESGLKRQNCNLGSAIVAGLLASQQSETLVNRILICVQTASQQTRVATMLPNKNRHHVQYVIDNHVEGVRQADVIILTCPPSQASVVLGTHGMAASLTGKLLISMLGGVSLDDIERTLYGSSKDRGPEGRCHIIRATTNVAAAVDASVTIIGECSTPMPGETLASAVALLKTIGSVVHVNASQIPAATALGASATAFFALMLAAAIDGGVALGLGHDQAVQIAAQTMAGAAQLALSEAHPATIRTRVTTPGGSTARGLEVLEEGAVRGKIIRALKETATTHRM
ncbi:pyrroline-5-carboxylate reductase, putative [Talaromyces stipitatus ATCC 10500]|uniref:Pyrroline-5-carboxylate reductase, putative n=1 Tax=Talaromyces stipitatus (strain ATCC 10500 / CBS 375.48 / QM 6759 / NRRL 1006) TaxID=441959 RepID=B8MEY6_TALSN|nr:pyrroline-5-carboxylate reductase, putative [Talaromyces stipitatus ATCC 10500]EED17269.1 pyrroline-5-carboxylate reductase, putative [Talaromyces stipitatus ATCC 10500]